MTFFHRAMRAAAVTALCASLGACGTVRPVPPLPGGSLGAAPFLEPSLARGDDWATFAHDVRRTSHVSLPTGISPGNVAKLVLRWKYRSNTWFAASPIVVAGRVYVVDAQGLVTSLAADTGKVLWHYKMSGTAAMSPSLFGGILYVGTHDPKSVLVALDPATGQRLWQAHVRGGLRGSPVVIGNLLYVGLGLGDAPLCTPGAIRVFNARTGEPGPRWFVEGGGGADGGGVWGPISYDGRQLLFGTGNTCKNSPATANAIVGMSPGLALNFSIPTKMPLDDDDVAGGIMVRDGVGYVIGKNGVFYAVDLASGRVRFSKWLGAPDGNGEFASPSFAASTLIVGGGSIQDQYSLPPNAPPGGRLYGLGLDGSKKWLRLSKWPVTGYVATSHGVAFADIDDKLDALDPATGAILWSYPLQGISVSSPAIGPSGLFATDLDGFVYAFGLPGRGAVMPSASAQVLYHLGRTPRMPVYCRFR